MTNFEVIIKEHPQFVKELLACTTGVYDFKRILAGKLKHDTCYSVTEDKKEMDFLNAEYVQSPVLDDVEKKYLSDVIRPFRHNVKNIRKAFCRDSYFIEINMKRVCDCVCLPFFNANSKMYKDMELNKLYTLEELGLQARPPLRSRFGNYLTKNKLCGSEAVREIGLRVFTSNAQYFNYNIGQGDLSRGKFAQN